MQLATSCDHVGVMTESKFHHSSVFLSRFHAAEMHGDSSWRYRLMERKSIEIWLETWVDCKPERFMKHQVDGVFFIQYKEITKIGIQ